MKTILGTIFGSKTRVPPHVIKGKGKGKGDRRSEQRIGERQRVRFFAANSPVVHEGIWINGSDGGAFIETNDTLPLLTVIRIEAPGLECQAQICRVHWLRPDERLQRSSGMAVRLLSTTPKSTEATEANNTAGAEDVAAPLAMLGAAGNAS